MSSTHAVYETPITEPFNEIRPYKSQKDYAYDFSKAKGEMIVSEAIKSKKIKGCIIRPSSVIGPFDFKPSEIGKALIDFYNEKIPVLPPGGYNFVDVRDVVQTILNAIEKGKNGHIYLVSGKYYTLKELGNIIGGLTGKKIPSIILPFRFLQAILPIVKIYGKLKDAAPVFTIEAITALKNGHPNMDNSKAKSELLLNTRSLKESLEDFYQWSKQRGYIK